MDALNEISFAKVALAGSMEYSRNIELFNTWLYLFFLLTPFCGLGMYVVLVKDMTIRQKFTSALTVVLMVLILSLIFYTYGEYVLFHLNINLDSLRVGAGILLFLTGLKLVDNRMDLDKGKGSSFFISLCVPVLVGPATISALIVLGVDNGASKNGILAVVLASLTLGTLFLLGNIIEKIIGKLGIEMLSRLNGLYMIVIAAQLILIGLQNHMQSNALLLSQQ